MRTAIRFVIGAGTVACMAGCAPRAPEYERAGKAETSYYGPWHRIDVPIVVPRGLPEDRLRRTIDRAIEDLRTAYKADVVLLRLFDAREDAANPGWTVGKAIYGPNGSLFGAPGDPFMTKVELGPSRTAILKAQEAEWRRTAEQMGAAAPGAGAAPATPPDSTRP